MARLGDNLMEPKDNLSSKRCVPCEAGGQPLSAGEVKKYSAEVPKWSVVAEAEIPQHLHREFLFKNFKEAMVFVNKVAEIAEQEGHHPDIFIFYNKVSLNLWTHAVGGLSPNDFILAAKIDAVL